MAEVGQLSADVMTAAAYLHADQIRRRVCEELYPYLKSEVPNHPRELCSAFLSDQRFVLFLLREEVASFAAIALKC